MTSQTEVDNIIVITRKAVSSALNEQISYVSIEIKEFSKKDKSYSIAGTFKVAPFFISRSGKVYTTIVESEKGLEIISLKIEEEKGL